MATDWSDLSVKARVSVRVTAKKTLDLTEIIDELNKVFVIKAAFGSGDNQVNEVWYDRRTLNASGQDEFDLYGGLTNARGKTVNFATVKYILIVNTSDKVTAEHPTPTAAQLLIGGAGLYEFQGPFATLGDKIILDAGNIWLITCRKSGWTVVNADTDRLRIRNNDAVKRVQYDIVLVGTAA